jgi:hypothetical protein
MQASRGFLRREAFKLGKSMGMLHPGNAFRHLDLNARRYGLRNIIRCTLDIDKARKPFRVGVEESSAAVATEMSTTMR